MKRYTYEITIEAEHEDEADARLRGLSLLTEGSVLPRHKDNILPLTEEEEKIVLLFRKRHSLATIAQHILEHPNDIDFLKNLLTEPN